MNGKEQILEIISNSNPVKYEELSKSYCRVLLQKISKKKKILAAYPSNVVVAKEQLVRYFNANGLEIDELIPYKSLIKALISMSKHSKDYELFIVLRDSYDKRLYKVLRKMLERFTVISPIRFPHFGMSDGNRQFLDDCRFVEYVKDNLDDFDRLYNILYDQESKETLLEIIRCAVDHDAYRLPQGTQRQKYWEMYKHREDECFVNCGSAQGDTIMSFLDKGYPYSMIYAFEGSNSEYKLLKRNIDSLNDAYKEKIRLINEYIGTAGDSASFDSRFSNTEVSLINMDIEGAEMSVLKGGVGIIKRYRPVLAVCAYHKNTDLLDIPKLINDSVDEYAIYLRKYMGSQVLEVVNEYLYYAIPKERILD